MPNPFVDPILATHYEGWYETSGRRVDRREKRLLARLRRGFSEACTLLEVGCGTGHFTRWFARRGDRAAGVDSSTPMLADAARRGGVALFRANASALPFATASFDLVAMITVLEFLPDPDQALVEALRVSRQGLILGVLNRQSLRGRQLKRKGGAIWREARFYSPSELEKMVQAAAGGRRLETAWRTTLWPLWPSSLALPWGGFIGLTARQMPGRSRK
jgi:ubiquinone/menaquinone biosynthesis C-methylase UbiE